MDKKEILDKIGQLIPSIKQFYETRYLKITLDEMNLTKEIWEKGLMRTRLLTSCESCVRHAFDVFFSYYEREYPKYIASIEQQKPIEEDAQEVVEQIQNEIIRKEIEGQKTSTTKKKPKKLV